MEKSDFIKVRGRNFICQLCDIKITSEGAVGHHLTGKKHLRLLNFRDSRQQQVQRSVFVGGLCRIVGEPELGDHFSKFGEVAQIIIDKEKAHYAIVEFTSPESAQRAAEVEKQLLNGRKIVVRPRQPKTAPPQSRGHLAPRGKKTGGDGHGTGKSDILPQSGLDEDVHQRLQQEDSVSGQMAALVQMTQVSPADQSLRRLICDILQTALEEFLPGCCITPFGSSVNGFGVRGCDLDIHLEPGEPASAVSTTPEHPKATGEERKDRSGPSDERIMPDIASASPLDVLSLVSDVVRRCVPSCHNVRLIPSARLPVVTFAHRETGLQCDISMNNRLALQNTRLLQFYGELETQVRPLVFAVRHWAKRHQLAGNVGAGPRLTNYALTLMVMFYLQAKDKPTLPSVAELKYSGEGWESTFSVDKPLPITDSTETQDALLAGFFSFYEAFDFATTVICPLLGRKAPLSDMLQTTEGCDHPGRSFKAGAVNIQDPFELWHNVALNVNEKTAERLTEELSVAVKLCRSKWSPDADVTWGLLALLDSSNPRSSKTRPSSGSPPPMTGMGSSSEDASLEIKLRSTHLSKRFISAHPDPEDLKLAWCDAIKSLVYRVISEALRFECLWSSKLDHTSPKAKDLITPSSSDGQLEKLESERLSRSVVIDSPTENAACLIESNSESSEPPPFKRCKTDPTCENIQSQNLQRTRNASQEAQPSTSFSVNPWHTETEILECTAYHPVWLGRRKARRQLLQSRQKRREAVQASSPSAATKQLCITQDDSTLQECTPEGKLASTDRSDSSPKAAAVSSMDDPRRRGVHTKAAESGHASTGTDSRATQQEIESNLSKPLTPTGCPSASDNILLESQVTDLIISDKLQGGHSPIAPILSFSLQLTDKLTLGHTSITLHFLPVVGEADFKIFLHFFDIYLQKMLGQSQF